MRKLAEFIDQVEDRDTDSPDAVLDFAGEFNRLFQEHYVGQEPVQAQLSSSLFGTTETIFLTGATGYIGSQLLRSILELRSEARVVVLVRAKDDDHALRRLKKFANMGQWWCDSFLPILEVWRGDLKDHRLGLTADQRQRLIGCCSSLKPFSAIVHNGATVNWFGDYMKFKHANTVSTAYLLEALKCSNSLQRFIYISGGPQWNPDAASHETDAEFNAFLQRSNGYGQSKLVAERLVDNTLSSKVHIIKPGFVVGTVNEGIANTDDFIWRIVAGSTTIRRYNEEEDEKWLYVAGTDTLPKTVMDCLSKVEQPRSIKLLDGMAVRDFWGLVSDTLGLELQPMSHSSWLQELERSVERGGQHHPCWPILHMAQQVAVLGGERSSLSSPVSGSHKQIARDTIKSNIEYLSRINYLPYRAETAVDMPKDSFSRDRNWMSG